MVVALIEGEEAMVLNLKICQHHIVVFNKVIVIIVNANMWRMANSYWL